MLNNHYKKATANEKSSNKIQRPTFHGNHSVIRYRLLSWSPKPISTQAHPVGYTQYTADLASATPVTVWVSPKQTTESAPDTSANSGDYYLDGTTGNMMPAAGVTSVPTITLNEQADTVALGNIAMPFPAATTDVPYYTIYYQLNIASGTPTPKSAEFQTISIPTAVTGISA